MSQTKILLDEAEIPTHWYNVVADMGACDSYFSGKLEDFAYPEEAIKAALERLPKVG